MHKLTTGALVWYRLTNQCAPGDVLVDAQVVVGYSCSATGAESLVGRNLATGGRIWSRSGNWQLQRGDTDTTAGRRVFATNPSGSVVSLNPLTGQTQYTLTARLRSWRSMARRRMRPAASPSAPTAVLPAACGGM